MATAPLDIYETTPGQELYDTSPEQAIVPLPDGVHVVSAARVFKPAILAEWGELASVTSEPNPFVEAWYVQAGIDAFDPQGDAKFALYYHHGLLRGILPLTISATYGRLTVRHVANWQHANVFLGSPLVERGHERDFWLAMIDKLDQMHWAKGFLHIRSLVEDGPIHTGLCEAAEALDRPCAVVLREARPIRLASAKDDPLDHLGSKRKAEYRRKHRRLAEQGSLEIHELEAGADGIDWCDKLLELEAAGWKGRAGSALASDEATDQFARQVLRDACARGQLSGLSMELDGKPIAMLSNIISGEGAFGFKAAFDEEFKRFSPGQLLQFEALKRDIPGGATWHDSCASEHHPVAEFWPEMRSIVRVTLPLSGLSRRLTHAGVRAIEQLAAQRHALKDAMK